MKSLIKKAISKTIRPKNLHDGLTISLLAYAMTENSDFYIHKEPTDPNDIKIINRIKKEFGTVDRYVAYTCIEFQPLTEPTGLIFPMKMYKG